MKLNSYKGIADRYFVRSKKRTILNIIAISLAIGLFAAIATFVKSSEETQLNSMKRDVGDFEVSFNDIPSDKVKPLLDNVELDNQGVTELKKVLPINGTNETIELCKHDDKTINDIYTFNLLEGRLPEKDNEIVITEKTRDTVENMKLGNKVKIDNVEYEVVGVKTESKYSKDNPNAAFTLLDREDISSNNKYSVLCKVKETSNKVDIAQKVAKDIDIDENVVGSNTRILMMVDDNAENTAGNAIYYFIAVVYIIIVVATVAVIYNSFNIAVTEKISQYGMLRAVGASPSQIRYLVVKEGILSWIFALPIGLISGIGALKLVLYIITSTMKSGQMAFDMEINIYPLTIIISAIISLVSVIISVLGPAIMAGKVSIIDTIRNPGNLNIKAQKIKKRKSRMSKLLFGFEGELAYKNVKRNNKRFIITVLSLTLSLLMFNTFTSMILGLKGSIDTLVGSANYDGVMQFRDAHTKVSESIKDEIKKLDGIKYVYTCKKSFYDYDNGYIDLDQDKLNDEYLEKFKEITDKDAAEKNGDKYKVRLQTSGISNDGIEFIKDNTDNDKVNIDELKEDEVILINPNALSPGNVSNENMFNYKVGDEIEFSIDKNDTKEIRKFKIAAMIEKDPEMGMQAGGFMQLIFNENEYENLVKVDNTSIVVAHKDNVDPIDNREKLQKIAEDNEASYSDLGEEKKSMEEVFLQIGIFAYSFIAVITLIAIVNIVNTVSMSILTRKKEFGIIKAIGMHQGQLSKMISIEGVLSGLYSGVIGSVASVFIMKFIVGMYSEEVGMELSAPYWIIALSGLSIILITYISALIPLRKLKNINLVESIKEE